MRMTIKVKLILLAAFVLTGLVLMQFLDNYSTKRILRLSDIQINLYKIESSMLNLRRNEKDFISRKDEKYTKKFKDKFTDTNNLIIETKSLMADANIEIGEFDSSIQYMNAYQDKFLLLAEKITEKGLDKNSGLYGSLRSATHKLEDILAQKESLEKQVMLLTIRRSEKDYMLRGEEKYIAKTLDNISALSLILTTEESDILALYQKNFEYFASITSDIGLKGSTGIYSEMKSSVHDFESLVNNEIERISLIASNEISSVERNKIIFSILLCAIIFLLVTFLSKNIIRALQQFGEKITEIRKGDDLTRRAEETDDEIGLIAKEFNIFLAHFQSLIKNIGDTADNLMESAVNASDNVTNTTNGILRQQTETDLVATAITEMGATAEEISQSACSAKDLTDTTFSKARIGKERLDETMSDIGSLSDNLVVAEKEINDLQEKSNGITSVLDVIKGIAEQTNLLALNAAIEAARAGEQGRGFAVVADEVRNLAIKTQDSTTEISNIIAELVDSTSRIVDTVNNCREKSGKSVSQANETEVIFNEIISDVERISDSTMQIATAVQQQSVVIKEVDRNVVEIHDIGKKISDDSSKNSASTENLADMAKSLNDEANIFNV